jgi:deoxyribonuclease-4
MPILGAHQSISGGYHRAVELAAETGCDCVQLFTKNSNQWHAKPITETDIAKFQAAFADQRISHPIAHDSYLINLASPGDALWKKSIAAFVEELRRAELLGIPYVVTHPGAFTDSDEKTGLARIAAALDEIHAQTKGLRVQCLLETTAGQGSSLGWRFEHFTAILENVSEPDRLGVCFDTCHVFAAGYPLATKKDYAATMKAFDNSIGLHRIKAFHLNDSRRELGSRVDRHEHLGRGQMGLEPFRYLLNDHRFHKVPMYLETPKGCNGDENWDIVNLRTLRGLYD